MPGSLFDESHLVELGQEYELFVGAYFEKIFGCIVIYQGKLLGKQDGGIDLIAISRQKTYLIQCKNYLPSKLIHENVVNQLSGSAKVFASKFPSAKNVTPVLAYTCLLDDDARYSAKINNVNLKRIDYQKKTVNDRLVLFNSEFSTEGYEPISAGLNMLPDYELRLQAVIKTMQYEQSVSSKEISVQPEVVSSEPVFQDHEKSALVSPSIKPRDSKVPAPNGKYFIRSETPLTFHFLLRFVLGPLNFISVIAAFFGPDYINAPWLIALDSIPLIAIVVFIFGASRFTKASYWGVLTWHFFGPVCYALLILVNLMFGLIDGVVECLRPFIVGLIWAIPTAIYYRKRKALFFTELIPTELVDYYGMNSSVPAPPAMKRSFYSKHTTLVWTCGLIAVFVLVAGALQSIAPNIQSVDIAPTATVKVATTVKPTEEPTSAPKPLSKPSNGFYKGFWYTTKNKQHWEGQLTVRTPDDGMNYCLIFVDADNPSNKCFSVFVWPGCEKTIDVPKVDNLLLYTVCGVEWYGYDDFFGSKGIWSTSDTIFDFDQCAHTLTFEKVVDGNWETKDIDRYEVPFLQ